jgi:hypothetical protein
MKLEAVASAAPRAPLEAPNSKDLTGGIDAPRPADPLPLDQVDVSSAGWALARTKTDALGHDRGPHLQLSPEQLRELISGA